MARIPRLQPGAHPMRGVGPLLTENVTWERHPPSNPLGSPQLISSMPRTRSLEIVIGANVHILKRGAKMFEVA